MVRVFYTAGNCIKGFLFTDFHDLEIFKIGSTSHQFKSAIVCLTSNECIMGLVMTPYNDYDM